MCFRANIRVELELILRIFISMAFSLQNSLASKCDDNQDNYRDQKDHFVVAVAVVAVDHDDDDVNAEEQDHSEDGDSDGGGDDEEDGNDNKDKENDHSIVGMIGH